jgi:apolipoprotein N-acyltransferase
VKNPNCSKLISRIRATEEVVVGIFVMLGCGWWWVGLFVFVFVLLFFCCLLNLVVVLVLVILFLSIPDRAKENQIRRGVIQR